jgi:phage baseplate assembly protein W
MLRAVLIAAMLGAGLSPAVIASTKPTVMAAHTYEARIRLDGRVSTTRVQASDAGQAKKLVQAQFGPNVTVLSVKRVD